ncbi:WD40/YVTN/BNR-like repeat-containing protein [Liquorilactobacillus mali]|uniref:WD40/YVTN/BNR-like repeat-containing protein n=1 Tax=Liquorilactobacillus mali TaxID=1618 RepID=UPI00234FC58D|nr:oxidoreductase [Liquorilactobacillus mali]MDC7952063.1 oxidoreductase [Liquorilactobacillus mali]
MNLKKWGLAVMIYIAVFFVVAFFQEQRWNAFRNNPACQVVQANTKRKALHKIARKIATYYQGWQVPYDYRVGYEYDISMPWQGENRYKFNYIFNTAVNNRSIGQNFGGSMFDGSMYATKTFYLHHTGNHWWIQSNEKKEELVKSKSVKKNKKIAKKAVVKSIDASGKRSLSSSNHSAVKLPATITHSKKMQYFTQNQTMFVTYDNQKTKIEVPNGYQQVFLTVNNTYNETLNPGSYIVTPEFTAFVAYRAKSTGLLYSLDEGKHWEFSQFKYEGFRGNAFISKTSDKVYVTYATDESLGTEYYLTVSSGDLKNWEEVKYQKKLDQSNVSLVYWGNDHLVYYASKLGGFNFSDDGGQHFHPVTLEFPDNINNITGGNPFTVPTYIYTNQGKMYLIMKQDQNGDYARNHHLMQAVLTQNLELSSFVYQRQQAEK